MSLFLKKNKQNTISKRCGRTENVCVWKEEKCKCVEHPLSIVYVKLTLSLPKTKKTAQWNHPEGNSQ